MLSQEVYMDVVALPRQGWTIGQIAEKIDRHPATVSSRLKKGGPPSSRSAPAGHVPVVDDRWKTRIKGFVGCQPAAVGHFGRADHRDRGV